MAVLPTVREKLVVLEFASRKNTDKKAVYLSILHF